MEKLNDEKKILNNIKKSEERWDTICCFVDNLVTQDEGPLDSLMSMEKSFFESLDTIPKEKIDVIDANETLGIRDAVGFRCKQCKQKDKTSWVMRQTRSADEGMTAYVTCGRCNITWSIAA